MHNSDRTLPADRASPVEVMLEATQEFHRQANQALAGPKADLAAAKQYMKEARKELVSVSRLIFPTLN